jgi:hypothetical protein
MVKEKKMAGGPKAAKSLAKKPPSSAKGGSSGAPATAPVNWTRSSATKTTLQSFVNRGELPPQEEIQWRAPGEEIRPNPKEGEVVAFLDHVLRGFRPPGSLFFRRVLKYYGLRPQDIGPNSILNISNFVVFCEDYLQIAPSIELFLEFFYCNPSRKDNLGPYGGVAIQRRRVCDFPALALASHPKGWQNTYFYFKDTSPESDDARYPAFLNSGMTYEAKMNSYAPDADRVKLEPTLRRAKALLAHGLRGTDLVKCWIGWFIQPLSIRNRLFHEYTEETTDDMRYSEITLLDDQIVKNAKRLLGEKKTDIAMDGLAPYSAKNKPPTVKNLPLIVSVNYNPVLLANCY